MPQRAIIKKCSFVGCSNNSKEKKNLKFYNFRKHDYRKWMTVCDERLEKLNEVVILSHNHVCENHFKRTHFHMYLSPHRRLTKDAFPVQDGEAESSWVEAPVSFSEDIMEKVLSLGKSPVKTDPPVPPKTKDNIKYEVILEDFDDSDDSDEEGETAGLSIDTLKKYTRKDHSYIRQSHTSSHLKNMDWLIKGEMPEGNKFSIGNKAVTKSSNANPDVKPPIFLVAIPPSSAPLMLGNTLLPMDPPPAPGPKSPSVASTSSTLDPSTTSTSSTDTISSSTDTTFSSTDTTSSSTDTTSTSSTVSVAVSSTPPSIHSCSTIPSSIVITSVASTAVTRLSSRLQAGPTLRPIAARTSTPQNDTPQTYKVLSLPPNMFVPLTFVPPNLNAPAGAGNKVMETIDDNIPKKAGKAERENVKAYKLKIEKLEKQLSKLLSRPCPKCKRRKAKDWQERNNPKFVKPPVPYNPKRFPIEQFCHKFGDMLGPYLTEVVRMQLNKNRLKIMRYSRAQLWLAASIMKGVERYGYRYLIRLFPFPAKETVRRELDRRKKDPNCKSELLWFDNLVDDDSDDGTNKNDDNVEIAENLGTSENVEEAVMNEFFENHFVFDTETGKISSSSNHPDVANKILRAEGSVGRNGQNDGNKSKKRQGNTSKKSPVKRLKKNPNKTGIKRQKLDKNGKPIIRKERKKRTVGPENEHERALIKTEREITNKRKRSLAAHLKRKKFKPLWSLYENSDDNVATFVTKDLPADVVDIVVETVDKSRNPPANPATAEMQGGIVEATINNEATPSYFNSEFVFEGYADDIQKVVDKGDNTKVGEFIYKEFASKPNEGGISGQIAYQKSNVELEEEHVDMPLVVSYHDTTGT